MSTQHKNEPKKVYEKKKRKYDEKKTIFERKFEVTQTMGNGMGIKFNV